MSVMSFRNNEQGYLNVLLIPLIISVLLLITAIIFGGWAFSERSTYKNNADEKIASAVEVEVEKAKTQKDNEFLEREKAPYKNYSSPASFGSFSLQYPKTWSSYSNEAPNQLTLIMQPNVVSSNPKTAYALKVEVVSTTYDQVVQQYENDIKLGKSKASAFSLQKVPEVVGLRIDGQVAQDKTGAAVFLPLRDKTIKIISETPERVPDFNNIILPNFEFNP